MNFTIYSHRSTLVGKVTRAFIPRRRDIKRASASRGGGSAGFAGGGGDPPPLMLRRTGVSPFINKTQSGFTLLELLVSITLIGLIVVIVGGAMRLGYRSVDKGEKKVETLERFRVSLGLMDAQIQSGIPLKGTGETINQYTFKGKKDSVIFASNYSLMGGQRGYVVVAYRVEVDKNDKRTLFAQENTIGMENQKEVKLLEGFEDIHFEYFLKDALEGQSQWVEEWTDDMSFPQKVRIHLAWGNQRISLVVPVRSKLLTAQSAFGILDYAGGILS